MERRDDVQGSGTSKATAGLRTRVPFDVVELDRVVGAVPPPRWSELEEKFGENLDMWTDSKKEPHRPKRLKYWVRSEAAWAEFFLEVQREVDIVKAMCRNERYTPVETVFDADFAASAVGKNSHISMRAHLRSLKARIPNDSDDESVASIKVSGPFVRKDHPETKPSKGFENPSDLEESSSTEETFNLEKELRRYVRTKTHILLSRVHDNGKIKWKAEGNFKAQPNRGISHLEHDDWYFGPEEFIILIDEDGKKTRTDVVVDRDEDNCQKIAIVDGKPAKKKLKWTGTESAKLLLPPSRRKELGVETDEPKQIKEHHERRFDTETAGSRVQEVSCEVHETFKEDRETRLRRRKMFRWERFRFRDAEVEGASSETAESGRQPEVPVDTSTLVDRRRGVADSLFQDDAKKYVEYVDPSEMAGRELHRPLPVLTAGNLSRGLVPEVVSYQPEPSESEKRPPSVPISRPTHSGSVCVQSETSPSRITAESSPAAVLPPTSTESPVPENGEDASKKGRKDKKKKKKRKSSSSSDDLEMLEKKSEARLGLRK